MHGIAKPVFMPARLRMGADPEIKFVQRLPCLSAGFYTHLHMRLPHKCGVSKPEMMFYFKQHEWLHREIQPCQ